ncbi:MAG: ABC transporter permease [Candidatus Latescibacterota bacterium]|nr:MAG: ABC transporter permease [Candidatus Latescibacterota bacterium]
MIRYLLRRIGHAVILVFVTLTATFFIIRLAPGDPVNRYYSPEIDPRMMTSVRTQLGLDQPLPIQYVKTMQSFVRGDFGVSISEHRPVADILRETIPRTLMLTVAALLLQVLIGLLLGFFSAWKRYSSLDKTLSIVFLLFYSIPSFYLAFILIAFFSLKLGWLPSANMFSIPLDSSGGLDVVWDRIVHMVLPVSVLSFGSAAALARYTRGSLLDVIGEEFIQAARAKGLAEGAIMWRHALKNALPQILTVIGLSVPFLLGGAVVVEKIFAWPGMGALMVDSIYARDYPVVLAVNFVAACMVILGNLLADLSYMVADPRIKLAGDSNARDK